MNSVILFFLCMTIGLCFGTRKGVGIVAMFYLTMEFNKKLELKSHPWL